MGEKERPARFEDLGNGCRVLITAEHSFTTDTLLLADFSMPRPGEVCADLGTGCGTIPLFWKSRRYSGPVLAIELQQTAAELAERSVRESGFSREIRVVCGDVRDHRANIPHQAFHLMVCNPPYYPVGRGFSGSGARRAAWHEESLTLKDLSQAARYGLRWGGRLCVCLPVERLAEAMSAFRENELEPKRLRLVQSGPEKLPYLFLLECRRGGKTGLAAEPTLILTDKNGAFTEEMQKIYGGYQKAGEGEERK